MTTVLIQMALLIVFGVGWQLLKPLGLSANETRKVLTTTVYYLFLPAMILDVLWSTNIGWHSLQYTLLATSSIMFGMLCMWVLGRLGKFKNAGLGAMILAAAFPNVTYLGLPVIEQTFGAWAKSVVIQIDLFATSPFLFTAGIAVARHYGKDTSNFGQPFWVFLNAPPFWAAGIAVILNVNQITPPLWLIGALKLLSGAVVPLMLFSLGLALNWSAVKFKSIPYIVPVVIIKMLLLPLFAYWVVGQLAIENSAKAPAVLDLAMPSMVIGLVLCDRYHLDSSLYAMAVTVTTLLSMFFLPLWHQFLMSKF